MDFEPFPKVARLSRTCVITEKIDGINAQIFIDDYGDLHAGTRSQWVTGTNDKFGFAKWCKEHQEELVVGLGPGRHFGEWWGSGIRRRYGLDHKRFSLFNSHRWNEETKPACCYVVPVLYTGPFITQNIHLVLNTLEEEGSKAAPGFMKPEGIILFHTAASVMFKKTLEDDEVPKSKNNNG